MKTSLKMRLSTVQCVFECFLSLPEGLVYWLVFVFTLSGIPRVSQCKFSLPLRLVCYPSAAIKNAKYKITVDTNKPPVNLNEVFPGTTAEDIFCNSILSQPSLKIIDESYKNTLHHMSPQGFLAKKPTINHNLYVYYQHYY